MTLTIIKTAVGLVVGTGTGTILKGVVANNVVTSTAVQKVTVAVATAVIGSAASAGLQQFTDSKIDAVKNSIDEMKSKND